MEHVFHNLFHVCFVWQGINEVNGAKRSEASSIEPTPRGGEAIGAPLGAEGLKMENGGQGELERFGLVLQLKRGFVRSILSIFPVYLGKRRYYAEFRDTFPIWSGFEQKKRFQVPTVVKCLHIFDVSGLSRGKPPFCV